MHFISSFNVNQYYVVINCTQFLFGLPPDIWLDCIIKLGYCWISANIARFPGTETMENRTHFNLNDKYIVKAENEIHERHFQQPHDKWQTNTLLLSVTKCMQAYLTQSVSGVKVNSIITFLPAYSTLRECSALFSPRHNIFFHSIREWRVHTHIPFKIDAV